MERLNFLLDGELASDLDYMASMMDMNRSEALRQAVILFLTSPVYHVSSDVFDRIEGELLEV